MSHAWPNGEDPDETRVRPRPEGHDGDPETGEDGASPQQYPVPPSFADDDEHVGDAGPQVPFAAGQGYRPGSNDTADFPSFQPDQYQPDQYQPDQYQPEQYGGEQYRGEQYRGEQYQGEQYQGEQYQGEQYQGEQYQGEYQPEQYQPEEYQGDYAVEQYQPDQYQPDSYQPAEQYPAEQYRHDQYQGDQYQGDQYQGDQYQGDQYQGDQSYQQYPAEQYPAEQYRPQDEQDQRPQPYAGSPGYPAGAPAGPQNAPHGGVPQGSAPGMPPLGAPPRPIPRPEDLLVPNRMPADAQPASWGWRGRLNRGSGGLFKAKPNPEELEVRQAITRIQHSFSRPMTVVVVQPKGGAGKTPTTICLSAAFGSHRGGYVVGWDDNETRGTLAVRVSNPDDQRATVWDLLGDLAAFERFDARVGDLSHYVRAQPDAHFDALVSDDNPGNMAQIGEEEFRRLHTVLQRFYRLIVVDTGNNVRSPNWQAAVNHADLVVVVSTYQRDVGYSGSWVLDHLAQTGREQLARDAVTILTAADPTSDRTVRDQLVQHFSARTRAVCEIPYDESLAHGGPIKWNDMQPATRNAWTMAGATVVDALSEQDAHGRPAPAGQQVNR